MNVQVSPFFDDFDDISNRPFPTSVDVMISAAFLSFPVAVETLRINHE